MHGLGDGAHLDPGTIVFRQLAEEGPVFAFLLQKLRVGDHVERLATGVFLVTNGADVHAQGAAGAVLGRDLVAHVPTLGIILAAHRRGAETDRRAFQPFGRKHLAADRRMRADEGTLAALGADVRLEDGNLRRQVALLEGGGADGKGAIAGQCAHRQPVALLAQQRQGDRAHELGQFAGRLMGVAHRFRRRFVGHGDGMQRGQGLVHGAEVGLDDRLPGAVVAFFDALLDGRDGLPARQDLGQGEKTGLHHRVDAPPEAVAFCDVVGVDGIEPELLVDDLALHRGRQLRPHARRRDDGVEQEDAPLGGLVQHPVARQERGLMTGDEVGVVVFDQVGGVNGVGTETQMGNGDRPGLARVVDEIALRMQVCLFADDLDAVLVGTDGAVGTQAIEHGLIGLQVHIGTEAPVPVQAQVGDVVVDTDGEGMLRLGLFQLVQHRLDHARGELLRGQAIAAPSYRYALGESLGMARHGGLHVLVQGLAIGAGFLATIQHRHAPHRGRQGRQQGLRREGAEQAHLHQPDPFPPGLQMLHRLMGRGAARTHHHQHPLRLGMADIVEQLVTPAGPFAELPHGIADNSGKAVVVTIDRLPRLEEDIGILRAAAQHRMFRRQRAGTVRLDGIHGHKRPQHIRRQGLDLVDLVRGAETIEEMQHRNAPAQGGDLRDQGEIHHLLHRAGGQQRKAGAARGHHVAVIAEDGQGMRGHGARGDMKHRRRQLAGDLVHVRQHQHQALRGGEGGGQGAGLQGAVHRAGGAGLALHLDHLGYRAPQVGPPGRRPFIGMLAHG